MVKEFKEGINKSMVGLVIGLILIIIFVSLWFFTLPEEDVLEPPIKNESETDDLDDLLEQVEREESAIMDNSHYYDAVSNNNSVYCASIINESLKEHCLSITVEQDVVEDDSSESDVLDNSNYYRAVSNRDVTLCDNINDINLRNECIDDVNSLN